MNNKIFIILIIGAVLNCIYDIFITNRLSEKEAKKCNYVCENCCNWRCYYKYCERKRKELNK